jgi:polar amino acid transport system ATP-binding protein
MSDRQLAPQRAEMGMVFQLFNLWPHLSVTENVAIAARKVRGLAAAEARELALEMLAKVHMTHRAEASPLELSGGQQQRVAIARALAQKPKLMLFDEPTSALDPQLIKEVGRMLRALDDLGKTLVVVSHDMNFARSISDQVIYFEGGHAVEAGTPQEVFGNPQQAETRAFMQSFQEDDSTEQQQDAAGRMRNEKLDAEMGTRATLGQEE